MFRRFDEMVWPAPCERMEDLGYSMSHGVVSKADCRLAASIISAYCQMIADPQRKRNKVVSELRKGPNI